MPPCVWTTDADAAAGCRCSSRRSRHRCSSRRRRRSSNSRCRCSSSQEQEVVGKSENAVCLLWCQSRTCTRCTDCTAWRSTAASKDMHTHIHVHAQHVRSACTLLHVLPPTRPCCTPTWKTADLPLLLLCNGVIVLPACSRAGQCRAGGTGPASHGVSSANSSSCHTRAAGMHAILR